MPGLTKAMQQTVLAAQDALSGWTDNAAELGIEVTQVNTLIVNSVNGEKTAVIFELDPDSGEYGMRTL